MAFLWRHRWKTLFGVTLGVGVGIYYNREYLVETITQGVANYTKNIMDGMAKEEEKKNRDEYFKKIQERCLEHTLQFLRAVREHISIALDVRPTLKLLKQATEEKDLKQKVIHWKTLLDLKMARVICSALAISILDTSFRVQFSILHRETRKRAAKAAKKPMIQEIHDDNEEKTDYEQEEEELSSEKRAEFIERGWLSISENLNDLATNVLKATTMATEKAGWQGEKFKARVSDEEILNIIDMVMEQLKDENGFFIGYKISDATNQSTSTGRDSTTASAGEQNAFISTMMCESRHMMTSPMFTKCLTSTCDKIINALKLIVLDIVKTEAERNKKSKKSLPQDRIVEKKQVKLFLAYVPKAMDRVRADVFLENMSTNRLINVLEVQDEDVGNFCAAIFEDE